jgi:hypothetical protein
MHRALLAKEYSEGLYRGPGVLHSEWLVKLTLESWSISVHIK